ncbi:MAG: tail fiber domain-containing protein [Proteobacteria bacterium]|nr:tail fiber domain-containing protein [Pseudomonadota bacterium]
MLTNFSGGSISTKTLTLGTIADGVPAASASIGINYTDSEGTTTSKTISVTATKALAGASGSKGDPGTNGTNGNDGRRTATGMVHYQLTSTSAPTNPTADSYTFSNGTFTNLTANWGTGAPTYASGNTNKYWYSFFTAVETSPGSGVGSVTFGNSTQAIGFSGLVSFTGPNGVSDGSNALTFGVAGTTLINGSNISTGRITSTNISLPGGFNYANGQYVNAGTLINLDSGSIHTKNFYISSSGDAEFKGNLSAAGGTFAGNLSAVGGTFTGTLSAANGDFSGTLTSNDGIIGGWTINSSSLASSGSIITLDAQGKSITINSSSGAPIVLINGGKTFADYGGSYSSGLQTYNGSLTTETLYGSTTKTTANLLSFTATAGKNYLITATETHSNGTTAARSSNANNIYRMSNSYRIYVKNTTTNVVTTVLSDSANYYGPGNGTIYAYFGGNGYSTSILLSGDGNGYEVYIESFLTIQGISGQIDQWRHPSMTFRVDEAASYTELNGAGLQAGEAASKYIKIRRSASNINGTNDTMLEVGGSANLTGDLVANSSDKRLKTNIRKIDSPLERIEKINGVFFNWNEFAIKEVNKLPDIEEVGLIAQEVNEVLPQIVKKAPFDTNENGDSKSGENYLTIQYEKIVPLLLEGIKELKKEIDELKRNK